MAEFWREILEICDILLVSKFPLMREGIFLWRNSHEDTIIPDRRIESL